MKKGIFFQKYCLQEITSYPDLGVVTYVYNPSTPEAEMGVWVVTSLGPAGLCSVGLSEKHRYCSYKLASVQTAK